MIANAKLVKISKYIKMNFWMPIDIINKFIDKIIDFILSRFFLRDKDNKRSEQSINNKGSRNNQSVINVGTQNIYYQYGVNPKDIPSVENVENETPNITGTISIKIKN